MAPALPLGEIPEPSLPQTKVEPDSGASWGSMLVCGDDKLGGPFGYLNIFPICTLHTKNVTGI